jgi:hypothetical protein
MSDNESGSTDNNDLGGSWLSGAGAGSGSGSGSGSDALGAFLRDSIPTPRAGYWDAIDANLDQIERDRGHSEMTDTDNNVVRPMAMNTTSSSQNRSPLMWAAAAAMVVLAGIGVVTLLNRGGNNAGLEVATAPVATAESAAPEPAATPTSPPAAQPAGAEPSDGSEDPDAAVVSSGGDAAPGALTEMQDRLNGADDDLFLTYCFAEDPTTPDRKILEVGISTFGSAVLFGVTPTNLVSGLAAPAANGQLSFELDIPTETASTFDVTLTNQTVTLAEGDVLDAVPCDEVTEDLDRMRDIYSSPEFIDQVRPESIAPIADSEVLSSAGLGPIRIGMSVSELATELGIAIEFDTIGPRAAGDCGWITTTIDNDIWVLVEVLEDTNDAVVRRISTRSDRWATPSGIRVGTPEQQLYDTFGDQLDIDPHVYAPDGKYITFVPTDPTDPNTVDFWTEEADGVVSDIHVGDRDWVGFAEGCA